jgi:hypothetical protein
MSLARLAVTAVRIEGRSKSEVRRAVVRQGPGQGEDYPCSQGVELGPTLWRGVGSVLGTDRPLDRLPIGALGIC